MGEEEGLLQMESWPAFLVGGHHTASPVPAMGVSPSLCQRAPLFKTHSWNPAAFFRSATFSVKDSEAPGTSDSLVLTGKFAQSCQTLYDPMDHSLPRFSSAHGLLQAGVPEWVAFAFSVGLYLMVGGKETGCVRLAESHSLPRVGLRWQRRLVHGACLLL